MLEFFMYTNEYVPLTNGHTCYHIGHITTACVAFKCQFVFYLLQGIEGPIGAMGMQGARGVKVMLVFAVFYDDLVKRNNIELQQVTYLLICVVGHIVTACYM